MLVAYCCGGGGSTLFSKLKIAISSLNLPPLEPSKKCHNMLQLSVVRNKFAMLAGKRYNVICDVIIWHFCEEFQHRLSVEPEQCSPSILFFHFFQRPIWCQRSVRANVWISHIQHGKKHNKQQHNDNALLSRPRLSSLFTATLRWWARLRSSSGSLCRWHDRWA